MAIMKSCCYCFSPKTGSMITAILSLIIFLIQMGVKSYDLSTAQRQPSSVVTLWGLDLFLNILIIISAALLIIGIRLRKRYYFWPWMIIMVISTGKNLISYIYQLATMYIDVQIVSISIVMILLSFFWIYCLLCVITHYQELGR
ncbi:unnamed protein product [Gordionus sp. m RMFG-2023]